MYASQGVRMLAEKVTWPDGGNSVEKGLLEMLDRMQTGRFKVFSHLADWFEEFRLYHRKDGKLVKEGDDIISATRYALMGIRFAKAKVDNQSMQTKFAGFGMIDEVAGY